MVWIEILRSINLLVCLTSIVIMLMNFVQYRESWNSKTIDYWYACFMWTIVGGTASLEGLLRHSPFRYSSILILAASIATLKGNWDKGHWGGDDNDERLPERGSS